MQIMLEKNPGMAGLKGFVSPRVLDAAGSFFLKNGESPRVSPRGFDVSVAGFY